jgi:hypothetical protein
MHDNTSLRMKSKDQFMSEVQTEIHERVTGTETNAYEPGWHGSNRLRLSIEVWRQKGIYNRQLVLRNTVRFVVGAAHFCVIGWADSTGGASDSSDLMRANCLKLKVKE